MRKVLIPTNLNVVAKSILEEKGYEVVLDKESPFESLVEQHSDAEALIVRSEKVTSHVIDSLANLKTIVRAGAGYDNIDIKYARSKKIDVMNTPGANANAVAEQVLGMMLSLSRHFIAADESTRSGNWEKKKFLGHELTGKTVGIVGLGAIGQLVCKRLAGFDVEILGFDPFISADKAKSLGVKIVSLEEIFQASDYITLHVPATKETINMVDEKLLSLAKEGVVIINCARAEIVNEDALRRAKETKKIYFGNDVYAKDAPGDKEIKDIAEIMLPHLGASTKESNINAASRAATQIVDLWEKGVTRYIVNLTVPPELDEKYQKLANLVTSLGVAWLGNNPVRQIEASYYGKLEEYSDWMIAPIVSALEPNFDFFSDSSDALAHLEQRGIDYQKRTADNNKQYGESMTIDIFSGQETLSRVSIRATLTEGIFMISRIGDFDRLYFNPVGHNLFFAYQDRPAVLGKIASILGEASINIHDIRAPHDDSGEKSLAILKVNKSVSADVVEKIKSSIDADLAFYYYL